MLAIIASAAILAGVVVAQSPGEAVVVNQCSYDVTLSNVPASGGGYSQIDKTLSSGDSYSQVWTELSNSQGWSIKLFVNDDLSTPLQYEYTFHNDGNIWYDLSLVNGDPFDGDWHISATSPDDSCDPKQQAYRYDTDDSYGMQHCAQGATITVTVCPTGGDSAPSSSAAPETTSEATSTSVPAYSSITSDAPVTTTEASTAETPESSSAAPETSSAAPETTSEAPAPSSTSTRSWGHHSWKQNQVAKPTTFATLTTSSAVVTDAPAGATVTEVATAVVTEIVTAYGRHRRHNHAHARA